LAVILMVVGVAAYNYLPALMNQVKDVSGSKNSGAAATSVGGGAGPMGEVNGAMDVSDALEGGAPSRPRAGVAKQAGTVPSPGALGTNAPAKPTKR